MRSKFSIRGGPIDVDMSTTTYEEEVEAINELNELRMTERHELS
jgi:hypothetical protein